MDSVLISVVVTGIFILVNFGVGLFLLHRSGKPYGAVKLTIHITLFVLILGGSIASFYKLQGVTLSKSYSALSLYLLALTLLINLLTGVVLIVVRSVNSKLAFIHKISTFVMIASIVLCVMFLLMAG